MKKFLVVFFILAAALCFGYDTPVKVKKAQPGPYKPFTYETYPGDPEGEGYFIITNNDCFSLFTGYSITENSYRVVCNILSIYHFDKITSEDIGDPEFSETKFPSVDEPLFFKVNNFIYIPKWGKIFELEL